MSTPYCTQLAYGFFCHTSQDECVNDLDCSANAPVGGYCAYSKTDARWKCATGFCQP